MPYRIEYSPDAEDHLREFTAREQKIILDTTYTSASSRDEKPETDASESACTLGTPHR